MSGARSLPPSGQWLSLRVIMTQGWGFELAQMVPGDGPQGHTRLGADHPALRIGELPAPPSTWPASPAALWSHAQYVGHQRFHKKNSGLSLPLGSSAGQGQTSRSLCWGRQTSQCMINNCINKRHHDTYSLITPEHTLC